MATYKIDALQKNLAESIPTSTLDDANRQYTELTMKYRDLLQNEGTRNAQVSLGLCYSHTQIRTGIYTMCYLL